MAMKYNSQNIERVIYNNKQVNITKYNNNEILVDNQINLGSYTGNQTISILNGNGIFEFNFTSNNIEFNGIKFTDSYLYYFKGEKNNIVEETSVYTFDLNTWTELYKSINVSNNTFVDTNFYDWFNGNYIK